MFAAVLFFACCLKGATFVATRSPTFVFLCDTGFAGFLVGGNFRITAAEEEAAVVFARSLSFVVDSLSLMLLTVAAH